MTKKGPLKITTQAQNKRPDPLQTTAKTVYDPTKEREPLQGSKNIKDKITFRDRVNFENQRMEPKGASNHKRYENFPGGEGPVRQVNSGGNGGLDGNGDPDKN